MERIFIATLGTAPAVVTETLWALRNRLQPWSPDRIELITTFAGAKSLCHRLLHPDGPLVSLFGTPAAVPPVRIFVPLGDLASASVRYVSLDWSAQSGQAASPEPLQPGLADVNDEASASCMGDLILHRVHAACHDPKNQLHLSISGGRKTMSAHALFSLGLVGNPQDEASHVLIGEAFDTHPDFWHPDQGGTIPRRPPRGTPPDAPPLPPLNPRDAADSLRLFSIAAPRYDAIPRGGKSEAPLPRLSVIIQQMNLAGEWLRAPSLALDAASNTVTICGRAGRLDTVDFVWLRLLATAADETWTCAEDGPDQPPGAVTVARLLLRDPDFTPLHRLRRWFAAAETAALRGDAVARNAAKRDRAAGMEAKLRRWLSDLAQSQDKHANRPETLRRDLLAVADDLVRELQTNMSKLADHLEAEFGRPLAEAMLPPRDSRPRAIAGLSQAAYRLAGASHGFLILSGDDR